MSWKQLAAGAAVPLSAVAAVLVFGGLPAYSVSGPLGGVALATALLLAWDHAFGAPRLRDRALPVLAGVALWLWLAPWGLRFEGHFHAWDFFHYYVGAKYFPELGYDGLYDCTLIADWRAGHREVANAPIRNLRTNELHPARSVLADAEQCTGRFSDERWARFEQDVAWFRARMPQARWFKLRGDHGYNATPAWGLLGIPLANLAPASHTSIARLMLLDPLLLGALFAGVAWAFGWRVLCIAGIFFCAYPPADWKWVGGSFLRYDWLAASAIGICLLKRGASRAAGGLLAYGAWLRLFPGLLFLGPALEWAGRSWRARRLRLEAPERRLLAGALAVSILVTAGGALVSGGPSTWRDFVRNTTLHADTPLMNHMGLRAVFSYEHDRRSRVTVARGNPDPYVRWREARRQTFTARAPLYWLCAFAWLALLAAAVQRQPNWVAAVLAAGSLGVLVDLTCYYYALLMVVTFLWAVWPAVGIGALLVAATARGVEQLVEARDEFFFWNGLLSIALVLFAMAWAWRRPAEGGIAPETP